MSRTNNFTLGSFGVRLIAALLLILATYNPTEYSYFDWAIQPLPAFTVLKGFVGVVLLIAWTVFIRATGRGLGAFGIVLASAFFGTGVWLIIDLGWLPVDSVEAVTWIVEVVIACVLAIGMSWSHVRRRMSGQADVDDVED